MIRSGVLVPQGDVLTTDNTATGAVSPYMTAQLTAPASGVPSP